MTDSGQDALERIKELQAKMANATPEVRAGMMQEYKAALEAMRENKDGIPSSPPPSGAQKEAQLKHTFDMLAGMDDANLRKFLLGPAQSSENSALNQAFGQVSEQVRSGTFEPQEFGKAMDALSTAKEAAMREAYTGKIPVGDPSTLPTRGTPPPTRDELMKQAGAARAEIAEQLQNEREQEEVLKGSGAGASPPPLPETQISVSNAAEFKNAMAGSSIPDSLTEILFKDGKPGVASIMGKDGRPHKIDLRDGLSEKEKTALKSIIKEGSITEDCPLGALSCPATPRTQPESGRGGRE